MGVGVDTTVTRSVDDERVFGDAIAKMFKALMEAAAAEVMTDGRVPIDTGALQGSLAPGAGVTESGGSLSEGYYAQVGSNIAVYPSVLEGSDHHHYLRGASQGNLTQGWLTKTIPAMEPVIQELASACGSDIEAAWKNG